MRKARIWTILVIAALFGGGLFLGRDMFAAIADAYDDRENISVRVNDRNDPKVLCSHAVETGEVAVRMEVVDVTKDIE